MDCEIEIEAERMIREIDRFYSSLRRFAQITRVCVQCENSECGILKNFNEKLDLAVRTISQEWKIEATRPSRRI